MKYTMETPLEHVGSVKFTCEFYCEDSLIEAKNILSEQLEIFTQWVEARVTGSTDATEKSEGTDNDEKGERN